MSEEMEVISSYSRAQAIADGVLIDVSKMAKEAGFKWATVVTDTRTRRVGSGTFSGWRLSQRGAAGMGRILSRLT
jgi:hypothetical protein